MNSFLELLLEIAGATLIITQVPALDKVKQLLGDKVSMLGKMVNCPLCVSFWLSFSITQKIWYSCMLAILTHALLLILDLTNTVRALCVAATSQKSNTPNV